MIKLTTVLIIILPLINIFSLMTINGNKSNNNTTNDYDNKHEILKMNIMIKTVMVILPLIKMVIVTITIIINRSNSNRFHNHV